VALTAQKGAEIFNLSYEDFAKQLEKNFEKLFPKAAICRSNA
jgi:TatD DNase family protein